MKRPCGNKEDVIGPNHAMLCINGSPLNDGQYVTLYTLATDIWPLSSLTPGNLVNLVDKNNTRLLYTFYGSASDALHINKFLFLFSY